ncbi:MAG TPA: TlpA disulfide reductase family protein [Cyclobacteriaceae bacterium]|nr:TlpA disulfide reductase family protein [Cyclobacteriaceae bacterium]
MKTLSIAALLFVGCLSGASSAMAQARVVKLPELKKVIEGPGEDIRVINFWATWCAPCIKELPLFEKLNSGRKDVKVTLVSMDMVLDPNPAKVHKFVTRRKLASSVLILDETDQNAYIDAIEKEWSGALPATIVINSKTGKRKFVERELHEGELEKLIDEVL